MANAFARYLWRFLPLRRRGRACSSDPSDFRRARGHDSDWTKLFQAALPRTGYLSGRLPLAWSSRRDCGDLHDRRCKRRTSRYSSSQWNGARASQLHLRRDSHRSDRAGSATGARIPERYCARTISLLLVVRTRQDRSSTEHSLPAEQWAAESGNSCNYYGILVSLSAGTERLACDLQERRKTAEQDREIPNQC